MRGHHPVWPDAPMTGQAGQADLADQAGPAASAEAEEASLFGLAPVSPDRVAAYGDHRDQMVDFYLPEAEAEGGAAALPAPLVLLFHGGAWRAPYDRRHISPFAAYLAGRGFVVASVEYRRGGPHRGDGSPPRAGRWPETLDDIAAAVDTVPGLARGLALPVDPARVVLVGHSAGGHAALWAAARHVLPPDCPWYLPSPPPCAAWSPSPPSRTSPPPASCGCARTPSASSSTSTSPATRPTTRTGCRSPIPPRCSPPPSPPPSCRAPPTSTSRRRWRTRSRRPRGAPDSRSGRCASPPPGTSR
ncbi:alpha/beta hydrolase [Streptomyces sp. FXJ1.4098]|nr:alpha/beta hydrolase [Streptomyces sp. FXJ1.4098]